MGLVALSLQCRLHLGAQDGRNSAPTYPINCRLVALAAETPGSGLRAAEYKHSSFYGSNDGELINCDRWWSNQSQNMTRSSRAVS